MIRHIPPGNVVVGAVKVAGMITLASVAMTGAAVYKWWDTDLKFRKHLHACEDRNSSK